MAAYVDSNKAGIVKLNMNNYHLWKFGAQMLLLKEDLWEAVQNDKPAKPEATWTKMDNGARGTIALSVEASLHYLITECKSAKEMWEKIKGHFERASYSSKIFLKRKLYTIKLEGNNMHIFIQQIMEIVERLRLAGDLIDDKEIISMLLCGLSEEYDHLITAIEGRDENMLDLETVKLKLVDEAKRREEKNSLGIQQSVLVSGYHRPNKTSGWSEKICYQCRQPGHIKMYCPLNRNVHHDTNQNKAGVNTKEQRSTVSKTGENNYSVKNSSEEEPICEYYHSYVAINNDNMIGLSNKNEWVIDSGATNHLCNNEELLINKVKCDREIYVTFADGSTGKVSAMGEVKHEYKYDNSIIQLILKNVLLVPDVIVNIVSISQLCKENHDILFDKEGCFILRSGEKITLGTREGGMFKLKISKEITNCAMSACVHVWHRRMGHRSIDNIISAVNSGEISDITIKECKHVIYCKVCALTKLVQNPYECVGHKQSTKPFQLLHTDVCGPVIPVSRGGGRYFVIIVDDFSRYCFLRVITNKFEVSEIIVNFLRHNNNKYGYYPQYLRSDCGGEYSSRNLNQLMEKLGIIHQTSIAYHAPQNGVSERVNRTIVEMIRAMLCDTSLSKNLWGEAASTACYIYNRMVHSYTQSTPYRLWNDRHPEVRHLRPMGSPVIYYVPHQLRHKLSNSGKEGILLGYGDKTKGYRILDTDSDKVIFSRSVSFNELGKSSETINKNEENNIELVFPTSNTKVERENSSEEAPGVRRSARANLGKTPARYIMD